MKSKWKSQFFNDLRLETFLLKHWLLFAHSLKLTPFLGHVWVDDFPFLQVGYVIVPWRVNIKSLTPPLMHSAACWMRNMPPLGVTANHLLVVCCWCRRSEIHPQHTCQICATRNLSKKSTWFCFFSEAVFKIMEPHFLSRHWGVWIFSSYEQTAHVWHVCLKKNFKKQKHLSPISNLKLGLLASIARCSVGSVCFLVRLSHLNQLVLSKDCPVGLGNMRTWAIQTVLAEFMGPPSFPELPNNCWNLRWTVT